MPRKLNTLVIYRSRQLRRQFEVWSSKLRSAIYLANGRAEGLALMYRLRPDLIFLEIIADQDDGWDILSIIRLFTDTPVVLIADRLPDALHRLLLVGNSIVLVQPISAKKIASASRVVLAAAKSVPHTSLSAHRLNLPPSGSQEAELEMLTWLVSLLSRARQALDPAKAIDQGLLDGLVLLLDADEVALYRSDQDSSHCTLDLQSGRNMPDHWTETQAGFLKRQALIAAQTRRLIIHADHPASPVSSDDAERQETGLGPCAIVPLVGHDHVHGALAVVCGPNTDKPLSLPQLQFITTVGETLALTMDNALLAQRNRELAILDEVTGIYSDAYAERAIESEKQRALRYGGDYAVLRLEWRNGPEYREVRGDQDYMRVLRHIATLSKRAARSSDVVARGRDGQIAFVLPETDAAHAQHLAARLTETLQENFAEYPSEVRPILATQVMEQGSDHAELVRPSLETP